MDKVFIGVYVLLGICILGLLASNFLAFDVSLLTPITWALLGLVLGKNSDNIATGVSAGTKKVMGSFKR